MLLCPQLQMPHRQLLGENKTMTEGEILEVLRHQREEGFGVQIKCTRAQTPTCRPCLPPHCGPSVFPAPVPLDSGSAMWPFGQ